MEISNIVTMPVDGVFWDRTISAEFRKGVYELGLRYLLRVCVCIQDYPHTCLTDHDT